MISDKFSKNFMSLSIILFFAFLAFGSADSATVKFVNVSNDAYKIYIDGSYIRTLGPQESTSESITKGYHDLKAIQETGYTFFPTEIKKSVSAKENYRYDFYFP